MGTFSIWHWLVVLVGIFLWLGVPLLAIKKEQTTLKMNRSAFVGWFLLVYVFPVFVTTLISAIDRSAETSNMVAGVLTVIYVPLSYFFFQRVVQRARDAGMGKAIAYWTLVPFVNIVTLLILLFKRSQSDVLKSASLEIKEKTERTKTTLVPAREAETIKAAVTQSEPDGTENDLKECPRCAELIKRKAKYCRFCQYEYTDEEFALEGEAYEAKQNSEQEEEAERHLREHG